MKKFKYKIIEYEYRTLAYRDGDVNIEVCKCLHETNSKLFKYLIILCFKLNRIKYEVVDD